jgi:hypothetical protein
VGGERLHEWVFETPAGRGIVCRGGGVADQVQRHFDALIAAGFLRPAP